MQFSEHCVIKTSSKLVQSEYPCNLYLLHLIRQFFWFDQRFHYVLRWKDCHPFRQVRVIQSNNLTPILLFSKSLVLALNLKILRIYWWLLQFWMQSDWHCQFGSYDSTSVYAVEKKANLRSKKSFVFASFQCFFTASTTKLEFSQWDIKIYDLL